MRKIIFATTNENKLREAREILGINVEGAKLDIDEIQTLDPAELIKKKAFSAYQQCKKPVLVEDTSLYFKAWSGLPGVFIDYFMDSVGNEGLIKMLSSQKNRGAGAVTYLGIFDGRKYTVCSGNVKGIIPNQPKGESGFGWDPIFIPQGFKKTFAEMTSREKNKISMRKKAFLKLKRCWIDQHLV